MGDQLKILKATWKREDAVREQDIRERKKAEAQRKLEEEQVAKESKQKQELFRRQAELKREEAAMKLTEFIEGKKGIGKEEKLKLSHIKQYQTTSFKSAATKTALKYLGSILLLFLNLLALSISLNCNKDENIIKRIVLALIAFFLSIPYLIIHFARIVIFKKKRCRFNKIEFFI